MSVEAGFHAQQNWGDRLKRYSGLLILLMSVGTVSADPPAIENAARYGLPQGIKEWVTRTFEGDTLKKTLTLTFDRNGSVVSRRTLDGAGNFYRPKSMYAFLPDGWVDPDIRYENNYSEGKVVSQVEIRSDGKLLADRYVYGPEGSVSEYLNDGRWRHLYYYNSAQKITMEEMFEGEIHQFTLWYEYDEFGALSAKHFRQYQIKNSDWRESFHYSQGLLSRSEEVRFNDRDVMEYYYDAEHRLKKSVHTYVDPGGDSNTYVYSYTYDEKGVIQSETVGNQLNGEIKTVSVTRFLYKDLLLSAEVSATSKQRVEYTYYFY